MANEKKELLTLEVLHFRLRVNSPHVGGGWGYYGALVKDQMHKSCDLTNTYTVSHTDWYKHRTWEKMYILQTMFPGGSMNKTVDDKE